MRAVACDYFEYKGRTYQPGTALDVEVSDVPELLKARKIIGARIEESIETAAVDAPEKQARGRPPRRLVG